MNYQCPIYYATYFILFHDFSIWMSAKYLKHNVKTLNFYPSFPTNPPQILLLNKVITCQSSVPQAPNLEVIFNFFFSLSSSASSIVPISKKNILSLNFSVQLPCYNLRINHQCFSSSCCNNPLSNCSLCFPCSMALESVLLTTAVSHCT